MNEEKFGVLRSDSPLPDLNDKNGMQSIKKYLPQIENEKVNTFESGSTWIRILILAKLSLGTH